MTNDSFYRSTRMNFLQVNIINYCANECHHQMSGERSVGRMVEAYAYAQHLIACGDGVATETAILKLARIIDPANENGYRTTPVTFDSGGYSVKAEHIQRQMELLLENSDGMTVDEFTKRFLEIHPFVDGNGRTAAILYNFLNGMQDAPERIPDYFGVSV